MSVDLNTRVERLETKCSPDSPLTTAELLTLFIYYCGVEDAFQSTYNSLNLHPPRGPSISPDTVAFTQFSRLGDVFTTFPLVKKIHEKYSPEKILFYTDSPYAEAAEMAGEVDRVISLPLSAWQADLEAGDFQFEQVRKWMNNQPEPDWIINCHDSLRSGLLTELLSPGASLGLRYDCGRGPLATGTLFSQWKIYLPYVLENNGLDPFDCPDQFKIPQQLLLRFGFSPDNSYRLSPPIRELPEEIDPEQLNVGLIPAAGWPSKQWPQEKLQKLVDLFQAREAMFYLFGAEDAVAVGRKLAGGRKNVVDLTGKTSLKETAAGLAEMKVVVSTDTGPLHLAGWLGCPAITLCGPTKIGPAGPKESVLLQGKVECAGCQSETCKRDDRQCLGKIQPEVVAELIRSYSNSGSLLNPVRDLAEKNGEINFYSRSADHPYRYSQIPEIYSGSHEIRSVLFSWLATYLIARLNTVFHPPSGNLLSEWSPAQLKDQVRWDEDLLAQEVEQLSDAHSRIKAEWKQKETKVDWEDNKPLGPFLSGLSMAAAGRRRNQNRVTRKYQQRALGYIEEFISEIRPE